MCPILPLLALGTLFGSPDIIIEANYSHFLAQASRAGRMKATEGKGPEKCFCLCAKVGHGTEVLPWTQKAGPSLSSVCHSRGQWLWLNRSLRVSWKLRRMEIAF